MAETFDHYYGDHEVIIKASENDIFNQTCYLSEHENDIPDCLMNATINYKEVEFHTTRDKALLGQGYSYFEKKICWSKKLSVSGIFG